MSILDNLPHRCRIERVARQPDTVGGNRDEPIVVYADEPCWVQQASSTEITLFQQQGMYLMHKIFFRRDLHLDAQHWIIVTWYRDEVVEFNPGSVLSKPSPDASAGLGLLWRIMTGEQTAEFIP